MTKKYYETDEFLALQKKWYGKLDRKGFKDIEYTNHTTGETGNLLKGTPTTTAALTRKVRKGADGKLKDNSESDLVEEYVLKEAYYQWAGRFYWNMVEYPECYSQAEIAVWELHKEGHSNEHISKLLGMRHKDVKTAVEDLQLDMRFFLANEQYEEDK